MSELFAIKRTDGRSNAMVVCDLVERHDEPGRVFSYEELSSELSSGCNREYGRSATQAAVRCSCSRLGRLLKRTMHCVPNVGYRLARAEEHRGLSAQCQEKANRQLKRGFEILADTRLDEIADPQARAAHEGQLLILSAIMHQMHAQEHRLNRHERLITKMLEAPRQD